MNTKKWLKIWFSMWLLVPLIAIVNYYVDPFWTFSHTNAHNKIQKPFNERQQKTNDLYFNGFKYDGILLGSSRSTYVNQNDFGNMNIYNYAFNSSRPIEFESYLDFAKELYGDDLKYVVIGADFFGTKKPSIVKSEGAGKFVNNTKSFAYRYKTLISISAFKESLKNISYSIKGEARVYYTRDNLKYKRKMSQKKRISKYLGNLKSRSKSFSDENYKYDDNYINTIRSMKTNNPRTRFYIYTSPIHANLLMSMLKNNDGRIDDYERWLREMVDVFGEVWHFMTLNSVTTKVKNYPDSEHYYENVGKLVANKISSQNIEAIPKDFGIVLNISNIDEYLIKLRDEVLNHKLDIKNHTF